MVSNSSANSLSGLNNSTSVGNGVAQLKSGVSLQAFVASLAAGAVAFAVEVIIFTLLRKKLSRIFEPRSYLVPERKRAQPAPGGWLNWLGPVFTMSNSEFISKSGLDAYFFLRYLRMLCKIFFFLCLPIFPLLIPINYYGGNNDPNTKDSGTDLTRGMDIISISNISKKFAMRTTAHLLMAVYTIILTCYIFYDELRGYVRMRQAYLTSPQHRLRASATTVLVTSIPRKWMTYDAMVNLYDVFPGGLKNIWLNRDYSDLEDKIKLRDKRARQLECAETDLIKKCRKFHEKGMKKQTKADKKAGKTQEQKLEEDEVRFGEGMSSGAPLEESQSAGAKGKKRGILPIPVLGRGLDKVVGGVVGGFQDLREGVHEAGHRVADVLPYPDRSGYDATLFDTDQSAKLAALSGARRPSIAPPKQLSLQVQDKDAKRAALTDRRRHSSYGSSAPGSRAASYSATPMRSQNNLAAQSGEEAQGGSSDVNSRNVEESVRAALHGALPTEAASLDPTLQKTTSPQSYVNQPATVNAPATPNPNAKPKPELKQVPQQKRPWWKPWGKKPKAGDDNVPLGVVSPTPGKISLDPIIKFNHKKEPEYPSAYDETLEDDFGDAAWKNYIKRKDRDTMRIPLFHWMPSLPLIGKKEDKIYWLRKEVARLNVEIEQDQRTPENYPLMNSAFLQFHSQIAAHMACQSLNHHVPQHMAPRLLEINPEDVIWENMRVKWWERYIRLGGVTALVTGLIILWAFPVGFVGLISQISYLAKFKWLKWIATLPKWLLGVIQGILPPTLMGLLLFLLPLFLRLLAKWSGIHTNMGVELSVQNWYFAFLVVQVFLVVSITQTIGTVLNEIKDSPTSVPVILATNLPKSANFFFSYLMLQAFAVSGATLLQIGGLIVFFALAPMMDSTAREKWQRQTDLSTMQWGTFFPVYTTLAVIGIVYSITSPIILFFNMVTFSLFWLVYRYNLMFVMDFRLDSGGLPFPKAVNQLFTGLYLLEGVMIGYFFIRDPKRLFPHAITMIVFFFSTIIYQVLLNRAFGPLFKYLPVTLEDDAAEEDERFAKRWEEHKDQYNGLLKGSEANDDAAAAAAAADGDSDETESIEDRLRRKEEEEEAADRKAEEYELEDIKRRRTDSGQPGLKLPASDNGDGSGNEKGEEHRLARNGTRLLKSGLNRAVSTVKRVAVDDISHEKNVNSIRRAVMIADEDPDKQELDVERQTGYRRQEAALFDDIHDEIEDLTPEERDVLVENAFQNKCLRAKRPVVWIPRDELGVSDDEIIRTKRLSEYIWISNENTGFDRRNRVVYRYNPPDFDYRDLIEL